MSRSEPESRTMPLVTVVTVTLNAGPTLQATMDSVLGQTYPRIESIVIDGGSTDGSVALLEAWSDRLAAWVSEPDHGIYDAMNKGIALARGDWVIFMNAGDRFAAPDRVEAMMRSAADNVDFLYGDVESPGRHGSETVPARPLDVMWQRISFSHQALFARTAIMKARPFDLAYDVIADYASYFTQYCEGRRFRHVPIVVASIAPAGYSERKLWRRTFERWRLVRRHRSMISTDFFYAKLIVTQILPLQLRRLVKAVL
ncbi:MAG: glycosyltransferase family 2 protein [Geminicoccaceae bacterium]